MNNNRKDIDGTLLQHFGVVVGITTAVYALIFDKGFWAATSLVIILFIWLLLTYIFRAKSKKKGKAPRRVTEKLFKLGIIFLGILSLFLVVLGVLRTPTGDRTGALLTQVIIRYTSQDKNSVEVDKEVKTGDIIGLKLVANQDGYICCLHVGAGGDVNVLTFDNALNPSPHKPWLPIAMQHVVYLPQQGEGWVVDKNKGFEAFLSFFSPRVIPASEMQSLVVSIEKDLSRGLGERRKVPDSANTIYDIIANKTVDFCRKYSYIRWTLKVLRHE